MMSTILPLTEMKSGFAQPPSPKRMRLAERKKRIDDLYDMPLPEMYRVKEGSFSFPADKEHRHQMKLEGKRGCGVAAVSQAEDDIEHCKFTEAPFDDEALMDIYGRTELEVHAMHSETERPDFPEKRSEAHEIDEEDDELPHDSAMESTKQQEEEEQREEEEDRVLAQKRAKLRKWKRMLKLLNSELDGRRWDIEGLKRSK